MKFLFIRKDGRRLILIGWKISVTGVSHGRSGGDIVSRYGIADAGKLSFLKKPQRDVLYVKVKNCIRMRMCSIPGFRHGYGLSLLWDGPIRVRLWINFIQPIP